MKAFLLILWNCFIKFKNATKDFLFKIKDFLYVLFTKAPEVMTSKETIDFILKTGCSVSRFGDGEIKLATGKNISFQKVDSFIQNRMNEVLGSNESNLLVCIPRVFTKNHCLILSDSHVNYWKKHLSYYRKYWYRYLIPEKKYGNAFISRHYMNLKNKDCGIGDYFSLVKKIWEDKDIIIVEGEKSRLGMGNDLFDNAKSVRRILGPSSQCFSKYNELLAETKTHGKDVLYILALGPAATVMAYDLAKDGYRAIDMGNIDTEYEWFLAGATKKVPIKNKLVYEARSGEEISETGDEKYTEQIIAIVK